MDAIKILYTRRFSDLGCLQEPHIRQYALTKDDGNALPYGVSIIGLYAGREDSQACRAVCGTLKDASDLLLYLYENSVEPCAVSDVIEDIRKSGAFPC